MIGRELIYSRWRLGHRLARTSARKRRATTTTTKKTSATGLGLGLGLARHACIVRRREHFPKGTKKRCLFVRDEARQGRESQERKGKEKKKDGSTSVALGASGADFSGLVNQLASQRS